MSAARELPAQFSLVTDSGHHVTVDNTGGEALLGQGMSSAAYCGKLVDPSGQEATPVAVICPHDDTQSVVHVANDVRYTQLLEDAAAATNKRVGLPHVLDMCTRPTLSQQLGALVVIKERMTGNPLGTHIRRGRISHEVAQFIMGDLLKTAMVFEAAELVHRDIKPDNVHWDPEAGRIWLHDLGYACKSGTQNHGMVYGSPICMAPEQSRPGGIVDCRTNLFPLGLTLLDGVTEGLYSEMRSAATDGRQGRRPTNYERILENASGDYRRYIWSTIHEYNRGHGVAPLSSDIKAVIHTATAFNPDDRYQTAQDMYDDMAARHLLPAYDQVPATAWS